MWKAEEKDRGLRDDSRKQTHTCGKSVGLIKMKQIAFDRTTELSALCDNDKVVLYNSSRLSAQVLSEKILKPNLALSHVVQKAHEAPRRGHLYHSIVGHESHAR